MKICSQWHTKFTKAGSKNRLWCHLKRAFLFRNWLLLRIPRSSYFSANLGETEDHVKTIHSGAQSLPITFSLSLSNTLIVFFLLQRSSIEPLQKASLTLSISFISLSFITLSFISLSLSLSLNCALNDAAVRTSHRGQFERQLWATRRSTISTRTFELKKSFRWKWARCPSTTWRRSRSSNLLKLFCAFTESSIADSANEHCSSSYSLIHLMSVFAH